MDPWDDTIYREGIGLVDLIEGRLGEEIEVG